MFGDYIYCLLFQHLYAIVSFFRASCSFCECNIFSGLSVQFCRRANEQAKQKENYQTANERITYFIDTWLWHTKMGNIFFRRSRYIAHCTQLIKYANYFLLGKIIKTTPKNKNNNNNTIHGNTLQLHGTKLCAHML